MGIQRASMVIRGALRSASIEPVLPTNTVRPRLSGSVAVDGTVTFIAGTWTGPATTFTYQLYLDGVAVSGATGPTYTFVADDEDKIAVLAEVPALGETAFSTPSAPVAPSILIDPNLFVGEAAQGSGNASTIANRAPWTTLNAVLGSPGVEVIGVYSPTGVISQSVQIVLNNGGTLADPVTILGVNASASPLLTRIDGARSNPWSLGSNDGGDYLRLALGADHLKFEYLDLKDAHTGLLVSRDITDLTVENGKFTNCRRGFYTLVTTTTSGTTATIDGLVIKNTIFRGFSQRGISLQYDTHDFLIEDCDLDSEEQDLDNTAIGVHISGSSHDGIVRRVRSSRCIDNIGPPSRYMQGDAFILSPTTHHVEVDDCIAEGCGDSGYGIDGTSHTLTDLRAYDCRHSFLAQNSCTLTRPKGFDARNRGDNFPTAHVYVGPGKTCTIVDGAFVSALNSTVPVFYLAAGASLVLNGFSVQKGSNAALVAGPGSANVTGLGTQVTGPVCTVNPTITGTKATGNVLNGNNGTWTGASTFEYQWLRDGLYIFGARSATYTVVAADLDADITRRVFAFDATGRWVGEATSAVIGAAVNVPPNFLSAPTISGLATVGSILTATDGTVEGTPTPTRTRQWIRGASTVISGATGLEYTPQAADKDFTLKVRNNASNIAGDDTIDSAATAIVTDPVSETGGVYIGPTAAGTGDGTSFANRKGDGIDGIRGALAGLAAGSVIKLCNDFGPYNKVGSEPIAFPSDGLSTPESRIHITGWNGATDTAAMVTIVGSRTRWTLPPDTLIDHAPPGPYGNADTRSWSFGPRVFRFGTGTHNLEWSHFRFEHCGDGCFFFDGIHTNFSIHDIEFFNVHRGISMRGSGGNISHMEFYDLTGIGCAESFINVRGPSHHITIGTPGTPGTFSVDFDSGRQDGARFCRVIELECVSALEPVLNAAGSNIELYRVRVENAHDQVVDSGGYWNGDGVNFSRPGFYARAYMEDCVMNGCTDGGVDAQAGRPLWSAEDKPHFVRCINTGNKMNFRMSHGHLEDCEGHDPVRRGGTGTECHVEAGHSNGGIGVRVEGGVYEGGFRFAQTLFTDSRIDCQGVEINDCSPYGGPGTVTFDAACTGNAMPTSHSDFSVPTFIAFAHKNHTGNLTGVQNAIRLDTRTVAHKVGDIVVALFAVTNSGPLTIIPDWNYFGPEIVLGGPFVARLAWRRLDLTYYQLQEFRAGTDPGGRLGVIAIFDGCIASGDPFEGYATTSGTGSVMTSPTTVVSGAGRMVCRAFLQKSVTARASVPAGYTQVASRLTQGLGIYLDTKADVGASTEPASVSNRSGTVSWVSFGFALKPQ